MAIKLNFDGKVTSPWNRPPVGFWIILICSLTYCPVSFILSEASCVWLFRYLGPWGVWGGGEVDNCGSIRRELDVFVRRNVCLRRGLEGRSLLTCNIFGAKPVPEPKLTQMSTHRMPLLGHDEFRKEHLCCCRAPHIQIVLNYAFSNELFTSARAIQLLRNKVMQ